jgi:tRNA modification GTPase
MLSTTDLIVAPATAAQPAARAIVRLTGIGLPQLLSQLFMAEDRSELSLPAVGEAPRWLPLRLHRETLGRNWGELPVAMLFWPGPTGPLGTVVAEVQLPGCSPLVTAVVEEACRFGARLARGGEFSLRSFLAGKIDLLQAEAVVAVVDARTPEELTQALDRMAGGVGRSLEQLRGRLLDLVADIEAAIDFADDLTPDAVPVAATTAAVLLPQVEPVLAEVAAIDEGLAGRDASGQGGLPRVVLAGPPNIGKSSLFNHLLGHEAALVEDAAGTTRDWVAAELFSDGGQAACLLVDLAGLAEQPLVSTDTATGTVAAVTAAADAVARAEIRRADVVLVCRDAAAADETSMGIPTGVKQIHVLTRCDRQLQQASQPSGSAAAPSAVLATSTATGLGIDSLRREILAAVAALPQATPAALRLRAGLAAARRPLEEIKDMLAGRGGLPADEALLAVLLRQAIDALGEVTGAVIGSDIIDRVFSRHCIGK